MRVFDVAGTAEEMALHQGQQFPDMIRDAFAALGSLPMGPAWLPGRTWAVQAGLKALGRHYLPRVKRDLEHHGGKLWPRVCALADGLGTSVSALIGINAFELESCNVPYRLGCTALGFAAAHMHDEQPRLAYNHDFPPAFAPFLQVRRSRPCGGDIAALELTYPTLVGAICGVNAAGLAVSVNQGYATDVDRRRPGVFVTMLVQRCLATCTTVDEAIELVGAANASNGALVTFVDAAGARAAVEVSPTRHAVRRAADGILHSFNKYLSPTMTPVEIPVGAVTRGLVPGYDVHRCNLTRQRRFDELTASTRKYGDADIIALLADHDGGPGSRDTLCRHDDPLGETIVTAIAKPAERSLTLSFGHACAPAELLHVTLDHTQSPPLPAEQPQAHLSHSPMGSSQLSGPHAVG